jgi:hypothetical protein
MNPYWLKILKKVLVSKILCKVLVPIYAIRGKYPWWMVTPDDPVSPFGSGTVPTASTEPTQMAIYHVWGRYVGDVVWLAWRNSGFGYAYSQKPDWLKEPGIKYENLHLMRVRGKRKTIFRLLQPDGTFLEERQYKLGPFVWIAGYRIEPIYNGAMENRDRLARGEPRAPRPGFHPNMDGRPIISLRTTRTM